MATATAERDEGVTFCAACKLASVMYRQKQEPHYWCRRCGWQGDNPGRRTVIDRTAEK